MLKLKYLFDNHYLAEMLLKYWNYDVDSVDLFKYFRISSNAIFPFRMGGEICYLRFAPTDEKSVNHLEAEMSFLAYLKAKGFNALKPLCSLNNKKVERIQTPWGSYYASVFKGVPGENLEDINFSIEVAYDYGRCLGELHDHSANYISGDKGMKPWSYKEVLDWVKAVLVESGGEDDVLQACEQIELELAALPKTPEHYGLIHFDFEMDNVFYDESTKEIYVIDFDDMMMGWYIVDVERALESMRNELGNDSVSFENNFLKGYKEAFHLQEDWKSHLRLYEKFAQLYGYGRIIRATAEKWQNEPDWLIGLRTKLEDKMKHQRLGFKI